MVKILKMPKFSMKKPRREWRGYYMMKISLYFV